MLALLDKMITFVPMRRGTFLPRVKRICQCGKEFEARPKRIEQGRAKYCSQSCKYKYRIRPTGLDYTLVKENPTSFKKGDKPWNTGRTDLPRPVNFKENPSYASLHDWVSRHKGKAIKCEHCGNINGRIEWANLSHEYKRDLNDWLSLCKKCHVKYDMANGWGMATKKFNLQKRKKV